MKIADYLDLAKARAGLPSDYALAKRLDVSRQTVSGWRSHPGERVPDVMTLYRLADLCDCLPHLLIADAELERSETQNRPEAAEGWRQIVKRLSTAATTLAVAAVTLLPAPRAEAAGGLHNFSCGDLYIVANQKRRRRLGALQHVARTLCGLHAKRPI